MLPSRLIKAVLPLLAFAALTVVIACGGKKDGKDSEKGPNLPAVSTKPTAYEGVWESACLSNPAGEGNLVRYTIAGNKLTMENTLFGDAACQTIKAAVKATGIFKLGTLEAATNTQELDFHIDTFTSAPHTDELVAAYNTAKYCGVSNWKKGVASSIATDVKGCPGARGSINYTSIRFVGQNLELASGTTDGRTAATRTKVFNGVHILTKKN